MNKFKCPICGNDVEPATNEEFDQFSFESELDRIGCPICRCFTQGQTVSNFTITSENVKMRISKLVAHGMIENKLLSYVKGVKDLGTVLSYFDGMLSFFPKENQ